MDIDDLQFFCGAAFHGWGTAFPAGVIGKYCGKVPRRDVQPGQRTAFSQTTRKVFAVFL